jgi:adenylate kinase
MTKHQLKLSDLLFTYTEYPGVGIITVFRNNTMIELIKTKVLNYDQMMSHFSKLEKQINSY